jgi:hypothetical protein
MMLRHQAVMARQRTRPAVQIAHRNAAAVVRHWPAAVSSTRTGAGTVARAIRALPRLTVETLTAGSLGFGAGLYLRRAPRIVKAIGVAPAIAMGASMLGRHERDGAVQASRVTDPPIRGGTELGRLDDDGSPSTAAPSLVVPQPG